MKRLALLLITAVVLLSIHCKKTGGGEVEYEGDVKLKGYLAYDTQIKGKRPGILIVHEWWGHNEYVRKRAKMLANLGYTALAVDMYGDGKLAEHPNDAKKFSSETMSNIPKAKQRFEAALTLLKNHPTVDKSRIAAIGYCFGGGVVLHMARLGVNLTGVVSFHGSLGTELKTRPGSIKAKILVCNGEADKFISKEQINNFKKEMRRVRADYKFIQYKDALHSFTNPDADKFAKKFKLNVGYNEAADIKSWQDMQDFFERIFK